MEQNSKYNRFGKIKSRSFALILLVLSCSLAISAYKSLGRSFDGIIVYKSIQNGFIKNNYNLYIDQEYNKNSKKQELNNKDIINALDENLDGYTKIGVSYFTYEESDLSMIIKKENFSPKIILNDTCSIDQGLFWGILSLIGVTISIFIYKNTLTYVNNDESNLNDEEELDL